jgi:hypothetical protein
MSGRGKPKGGPKAKKKLNSHKGQQRRFGDPPPEDWEINKGPGRPTGTRRGDENEPENDEENGEEQEEEGKASESEESEEEIEPAGPVKSKKVEIVAGELKNVTISDVTSSVSEDGNKNQLTRREREELEKQAAKAAYQRLHLQGKTEEAKRDLERLAQVRKEREEAAKRREEEKKAKLDAKAKPKLQQIKK